MTTNEINSSSVPNNLAHAVKGNQAGMLLGFYEFLLKSTTGRDPKIPFALRAVSSAVKESIDSITPVLEKPSQQTPVNNPQINQPKTENPPAANEERFNIAA